MPDECDVERHLQRDQDRGCGWPPIGAQIADDARSYFWQNGERPPSLASRLRLCWGTTFLIRAVWPLSIHRILRFQLLLCCEIGGNHAPTFFI